MDAEGDLDLELPPIAPAPPLTKKPLLNHKRTWDYDAGITNSSDPAVFSSDDHVSGSLDDYTSKRRKYQWKGTWWGERTKRLSGSRHRMQREFKRNYDSGIFMGSETTESSLDEEFLDDIRRTQDDRLPESLVDETPASNLGPEVEPSSSQNGLPVARTAPVRNPISERVRNIVYQCLDDGNESIDLSSMYISNTTLPNVLLTPLHSLTKYTSIHTPPTSQEAYESLEPHLRVFLSSNLLTTVPSELFNLSNLHVLSLRQNQLTEIPPAISRLTNLVELNIGGNQLSTLPWEILHMLRTGQLKKFSPFPNPFRRFQLQEMLPKPKARRPAKASGALPLSPIAKSSITYLNVNGTTIPVRLSSSSALPPHSPTLAQSRVPSLLELSLRTTTRLPYFADLVAELRDDSAQLAPPETLTTLLTHASNVLESGGQICPTCHSSFVVARAEWVEWWDLSTLSSSPLPPSSASNHSQMGGDEAEPGEDGREEQGRGKERPFVNVVPFRKRVCSWGCI